jgi:hypothetical protein
VQNQEGEDTTLVDSLGLGPADQIFPAFQGRAPQIHRHTPLATAGLEAARFLFEIPQLPLHKILHAHLSLVIMRLS